MEGGGGKEGGRRGNKKLQPTVCASRLLLTALSFFFISLFSCFRLTTVSLFCCIVH